MKQENDNLWESFKLFIRQTERLCRFANSKSDEGLGDVFRDFVPYIFPILSKVNAFAAVTDTFGILERRIENADEKISGFQDWLVMELQPSWKRNSLSSM